MSHMVMSYFFASQSAMSQGFKVGSLLEWCFIISIDVSSDHFQLQVHGFFWKPFA